VGFSLRQRTQQNRRIFNSAAGESRMAKQEQKLVGPLVRQNTPGAEQTIAWFETYDPATGRWQATGANRISIDGCETQTSSHSHSRPA
jgi:hypothetical protein